MGNAKDKNLTRFLLTFFFGWIGSIIINCTDLKPKGYTSRTLAYIFLTAITGGIYGLVAAIANLSFDPAKGENIGYKKDYGYVYNPEEENSVNSAKEAGSYAVQSVAVKTPKSSIQELVKKSIVVIMGALSIIMLSVPLIAYNFGGQGFSENGYTFMLFFSDIIQGSDFIWAKYLIGTLSSFIFIAAVILFAMSVINACKSNKPIMEKIIMIGCIVLAAIYTFIGVITVMVTTVEYEMPFISEAFKVLITQIVLFAIYKIVDKYVPNKQ